MSSSDKINSDGDCHAVAKSSAFSFDVYSQLPFPSKGGILDELERLLSNMEFNDHHFLEPRVDVLISSRIAATYVW